MTPAPASQPYSRGELAVAAAFLVPLGGLAVGYVLLLGATVLNFATNTVRWLLQGDPVAIGLVVVLAALFALCGWASRRGPVTTPPHPGPA
jgi:hypothetical protein